MENCPESGLFGEECRKIPGKDKDCCLGWISVEDTTKKQYLNIMAMILEGVKECPFREVAKERVRQKLENLGEEQF